METTLGHILGLGIFGICAYLSLKMLGDLNRTGDEIIEGIRAKKLTRAQALVIVGFILTLLAIAAIAAVGRSLGFLLIGDLALLVTAIIWARSQVRAKRNAQAAPGRDH